MEEKINFSSELWRNIKYNLADVIIGYSLTNKDLNSDKSLGRIIYHYASLQSFLSIIENQSLFCTNINYLNDKKEYQHGIDQILKVVKKLQEENFYKIILDNFNDHIDIFYKKQRYVSCFSKEGDMLSQWRAYANQGKGVSIGFDLNNFESSVHQLLTGSQVLYDEELQLKSIENIMKIIINNFEEIKEKVNWDDYGYERMVQLTIIDFLEAIIPTYKSMSFSEEKEFRFQYNVDGNVVKKEYEEIHFRTTESMLVPYIILDSAYKRYKRDLENDGHEIEHSFLIKNLPIKEIIIGYSLDFELTKISIEELLEKYEYKNVEIKKSLIPYR